MARVLLIDLDESTSQQIAQFFVARQHYVANHVRHGDDIRLDDAEIVFAGGHAYQYLALLREVRRLRPELPFIVIARDASTTTWLDALEAGATDYYHAPLEARQVQWTMELVGLRRHRESYAAVLS